MTNTQLTIIIAVFLFAFVLNLYVQTMAKARLDRIVAPFLEKAFEMIGGDSDLREVSPMGDLRGMPSEFEGGNSLERYKDATRVVCNVNGKEVVNVSLAEHEALALTNNHPLDIIKFDFNYGEALEDKEAN